MSTPPLDVAAAALRAFLHASGAVRAQALVDAGPDAPPALVACSRLGPIEVVVGDREIELPHDHELDADPPDLGEIRLLPPFAVDAERGEVTGAIGGLRHLGDAVMRLAVAIGRRTVAVAEFETTTAGLPLVLTARFGEPVMVTLGEESFEL